MGVTSDPGEVGLAGGRVSLTVSARNAGGTAAADVVLKLRLPAGATLDLGDSLGGWNCVAAAATCTRRTLAAGSATSLVLGVNLPSGTDGQKATITVRASTRSPESSTRNNSASATIAYGAKPDLAFTFEYADGGISYLGGNGARAFAQARATNIGTAPAPGARFTFQMPADAFPGAWTTDPEWDCDFSTSTWVCASDSEIAPGRSAYLNFFPYFPAGTVGDTRTVTASVSTSAPEKTLANNSGSTTFTYVVPPLGDLELRGVGVSGRHELRANEEFDLSVFVNLLGGSPAENATVRVPLPATVEPTSLDPGDTNWTCRLDDASDGRFIECTRPYWDIGTLDTELLLKLKVNAGTPQGPLTFSATASASTPEASLENNTATGELTYVAEGVITGQGWIDTNRDGQRDADEPSGYGKVGRVEFVLEGTEPTWDTPYANVYENGTYRTRLKPGRYVANVHLQYGIPYTFTTPNVGDDATDSDIIGSTGGYYNRGWSAVVDVSDAGQTLVDIGLVPTAQS